MPDCTAMLEAAPTKYRSAIYITFPGNCEMALRFYHACFGGELHIETFDKEIPGYTEKFVVSGSLIADRIIIHGSDLVHDEGRQLGNYMSIFLQCKSTAERNLLIEKLHVDREGRSVKYIEDQPLVEVIDAFEVRWVLGV